MDSSPNPCLILGAALSALAALMHLGCIVFGAPWYRFFGAGERMARSASAGSPYPAIVTSAIAFVLAGWSIYALSAAGLVPRLPFVRVVLCLVTGIYLLRGMAVFPAIAFTTGRSNAFWWWSSAICLVVGLIHLAGLVQVWPRL